MLGTILWKRYSKALLEFQARKHCSALKKVSTFHIWPRANTKPNICTAEKVKKTKKKKIEEKKKRTWEQSQQSSTVTKRIRKIFGRSSQPATPYWGHKTDQQWTESRFSCRSLDHPKVTISYSKVSRCLAIMVITRDYGDCGDWGLGRLLTFLTHT